jgi:diguanylate cyclase (GGDEF)-like protein
VTISIGVAYARPGDGPSDVLERADRALYRAKNAGRNRVVESHLVAAS